MYRRFAVLLIVPPIALWSACGRGSQATATDLIKSADALVAQNKPAEAITQYRLAVEADKRSPLARQRLGEAFALIGDNGRAAEQLARAADLSPEDMALQLEAARALLVTGNFEDARSRAEIVARKDNKNVGAQIVRATAAAGMKDATGALSALDTITKLNPARARTYVERGQLQASTGRTDEAEAGFKQAIATNGKSPDGYIALANFYWSHGRPADAEQVLKRGIAAIPRDVSVNVAMANLYIVTRRASEAEAPLRATVEAAPNDVNAKLRLADYYVSQKKGDAARPLLQSLSANKDAGAAAGTRLAGMDYDAGNATAAYQRLDDLIKKDPINAQLLTVKGTWRLHEGKSDEALSLAQQAVKLDPRATDALNLLGRAQLAKHGTADAEKSFAATLQVDPKDPDALVAMTHLNIARGRSEEALTMAKQAVAAAPTDGVARLALASALFATGDVSAAQAELAPVMTVMSNSAAAVTLQGQIDLRAGNTAAARDAFTRAVKLDPQMTVALSALVDMDLKAKRPADAIRLLETHADASKRSDVLVVAGRAYAVAGDLAKAESSLRKAIELDPSTLEAYNVLGQVYIRQNKLGEALKAYEQRITERPNDVSAHTMVGMIQLVQGKQSEARSRFETVLGIDPRAPVASNNLAYLDADAGTNLDVALNRAQTAKAALPDDPDVNDTLGWVYVKRNLPALGVTPLQQAIQTKPSEPMYHYHLGVAYAKNGDKDRARQSLEKALSLSPSFQGAADAKRTLDTLGR